MISEDWIGVLPPTWAITRLGALGRLAKGSGGTKEDNRDTGVAVVRYGELYSKFDRVIRAPKSFISPEDASRYTPLPTGSLVFAGSGEDPEEIGKAALSLLPAPAFVGGDSVIFTPRSSQIDPIYLTYVLEAKPLKAHKAVRATGFTVVHISAGKLKTLPIPLPPPDEQRTIADYLDHETTQIDALVAKQEEFIGLLRERRDAVVRLETTQPAAGGCPVDRLGRSAKVGNGSTPRRDVDVYWRDGDVPWLTSTVVNRSEVNSADQFVTEVAVRHSHLPMLEPGTLLIGLIGQGPTRGMTTISRVRATLSQNLAYIAPDKSKWKPEYLLWALRASYQEIRQKGAESGAAQGMLNTDDIRRIRVAMPPIAEQQRIVAQLDDQTARIDALIAKAEQHIALAKERRVALITAAVTGQIDVRTAARRAS